MGTVRYFTGVQYLCTFNIVAHLLFISFCQMFGRRRTPSARPSCVIPDPSQCFLSHWQRNRIRMDSYRVSTIDVPESPISSGARGPWQQRCDSLHCHEECWSSVPSSVVVFSWVHAITISSPKWNIHRCRLGGSMRACHAAGPGSISGRDKFPGWVFFGVFSRL